MTQHFDFAFTVPATNPCTGNPISAMVTTESVFHITFFTAPGANEVWGTGTDVNRFTTTADPVTGVTFTGQGADWFGFSLNQNNTEMGGTFNLTGVGSDGSHVTIHMVMHITVASFGPPPVITSNVNIASATCH
jgi:hypothetical protein